MSCNHCNVKFGLFNKELGCANCGLSLCGNCLPQKWQNLGKVCRTCLPKLTDNVPDTFSPPDRFLKRLEKPPVTIYKPALTSKLCHIDQQLAERLAKLKEKPKTTDSEIRQRLAKLKGQSPSSTAVHNEVIVVAKSDQEQVDALLEQLSKEPLDKMEENRSESPELPWCVLCNNDAEFRCLDCGGDLYCGPCNAEGHKEWGETSHRAEPYKNN